MCRYNETVKALTSLYFDCAGDNLNIDVWNEQNTFLLQFHIKYWIHSGSTRAYVNILSFHKSNLGKNGGISAGKNATTFNTLLFVFFHGIKSNEMDFYNMEPIKICIDEKCSHCIYLAKKKRNYFNFVDQWPLWLMPYLNPSFEWRYALWSFLDCLHRVQNTHWIPSNILVEFRRN